MQLSHQDQRIDVLILTPLASEYAAMHAHIDNPIEDTHPPELFMTGYIGPHRVRCIFSGRGKPNTAAVLQDAVIKWSPHWIFLVGIAGGFPDKGVRCGHVITPNYIYDANYGKITRHGFERRAQNDFFCSSHLRRIAATLQSEHWRPLIRLPRPDGKSNTECHLHYDDDCNALSSDAVMETISNDFFQTARRSCPDLYAVEMEGSGVCGVIKREQTRGEAKNFLMVRGISDEPSSGLLGSPLLSLKRGRASPRPVSGSNQRAIWGPFAAAAAAAVTTAIIRRLPPPRIPEPFREVSAGLSPPPEADSATHMFHKIVQFDWSYIHGDADSRRDVSSAILGDIGAASPSSEPALVCLVGEPLSGKSTILARVCFDLATDGGRRKLVLRLPEQLTPSAWRTLKQLCTGERRRRRVFLLLEDDPATARALKSLADGLMEAAAERLPLTILFASLKTEHIKRIERSLLRADIALYTYEAGLTENDKSAICARFADTLKPVSRALQKRLLAIDRLFPFLVYLREVAEGSSFVRAMGESAEFWEDMRLERLRGEQLLLYRCYGYVCFAHAHMNRISTSVLEKVEDGEFMLIRDLKRYGEFIFETTESELERRTCGAAHWYLARVHWDDHYKRSLSPPHLARAVMSAVNVELREESIFLSHFCRTLQAVPGFPFCAFVEDGWDKIKASLPHVGVDHVLMWANMCSDVGLHAKVEECHSVARSIDPLDSADAIMKGCFLEKTDVDAANACFKEQRGRYPRDASLLAAYCGFLTRHRLALAHEVEGVLKLVPEMLSAPAAWTPALGAIVPLDPSGQSDMSPLGDWISKNRNHPHIGTLWVVFLKAMEHRPAATPLAAREQLEALADALDDVVGWVDDKRQGDYHSKRLLVHYCATRARKKLGPDKQMEWARLLRRWLAENPNDGPLWNTYLELLKGSFAEPKEVIRALGRVKLRMDRIRNSNTIVNFLNLGELCASNQPPSPRRSKKLSELRSVVHQWLDEHWDDAHARRKFLAHCTEWADDSELHALALRGTTCEWLTAHPADQGVRISFLDLIQQRFPEGQDEAIIKTEKWLETHQTAKEVKRKLESMKKKHRVSSARGAV